MIAHVDTDTAFADFPDVMDAGRFKTCYHSFKPRERPLLFDWAIRHIKNDQGRPYDHAAYPHLGAPGGPMDAWDDIHVREIAEQFATRLGKSFLGQCALLYTADVDPAPMLCASESERSLKRINARTYQMIYRQPRLRKQMRYWTERDHRVDLIEFRESKVYTGWARSAGTLADMNIKVSWANELDKDGWEPTTTTREGAPMKLFADRSKDYWSVRKMIWESTPTVRGHSRIEAKRLAGWNCHYHVPCPKCKKYQRLNLKDDEDKPRIVPDDGSGAVYECEHCRHHIPDHERPWMMRRGVWCPAGCAVKDKTALNLTQRFLAKGTRWKWRGWKKATWISGTPDNDGEIASYHLSSLYALSLGWMDILAEWRACRNRPELMRNFVNQWLGDTWVTHRGLQTWRELARRLLPQDFSVPHLIVPAEHVFLSVGVDRQLDHYVFVVDSWGPGRSSHTIDYGAAETTEELFHEVINRKYLSEGGGQMRPAVTLIDRGFSPKEVDDFCVECQRKRKRNVIPCRGASKPLNSAYSKKTLGKDSASPGVKYVAVDGMTTQDWLQMQLYVLTHPDEGCTTLFAASPEDHQDFLEQLLNQAPDDDKPWVWDKISTSVPDDYRDCKRYAAVGMLLMTRGAPIRAREMKRPKKEYRDKPVATERPMLDRPGGWGADWR